MAKQHECAKFRPVDLLHYVATMLFEELPKASRRAIMLLSKQFLADFRRRVTKVRSRNVEGLQHLPSLTSLHLSLNDEHALPGVTSLQSLIVLNITVGMDGVGEDGVLNLAPVSMLPLLESLRVDASAHLDDLDYDYESVPRATVEPLAALTNLVSLAILGCYLGTLRPIAGLTRLTALEMQPDTYDRSTDQLCPVTSLCQLKTLTLHGTYYGANVALAPLTSMTSLTSLYLLGMQGIDLAPIRHMQLRVLTISGTLTEAGPDVKLEPVGACVSLESMDLSFSPLSDLAPLAALSHLKSLDISWTKVADVSPLAACSRLVHLDVFRTHVTDLGPLAGLTNLKVDGFGVK